MAEVSVGGVSFKGGKMFAVLLALSSAVGALYGGFEFWKKFQDMSAAIEAYTAPDLSGFDKKIALVESNTNAQMEIVLQKVEGLKSELDIVLEEILYLNILDPVELEFVEEVFEYNDVSMNDGEIEFVPIEAPVEEVTVASVELEIAEIEIN